MWSGFTSAKLAALNLDLAQFAEWIYKASNILLIGNVLSVRAVGDQNGITLMSRAGLWEVNIAANLASI